MQLTSTIFHEPWWLDAASPGDWREAVVRRDGETLARLPYLPKRVCGVRGICMPAATHVLGPQLPIAGHHSTVRMSERRTLVEELLAQLPDHGYFHQVCDVSVQDALPMYALGFDLSVRYTIRIAAMQPLPQTWAAMRKQTRNEIRRATERFSIDRDVDVDEFCRLSSGGIQKNHKVWWSNRHRNRTSETIVRLYEAFRRHDSGCLLGARDDRGVLRAAIMPVWGHGVMYYQMTAQDYAPASAGSIRLLLWEAIQMAARRGLAFDFDGFARPAGVTILTGFGGEVCTRIAISKMTPAVQLVHAIKSRLKLAF